MTRDQKAQCMKVWGRTGSRLLLPSPIQLPAAPHRPFVLQYSTTLRSKLRQAKRGTKRADPPPTLPALGSR